MPALGALSGNQAMQMVRAGLKAVYCSGWQVGKALLQFLRLPYFKAYYSVPGCQLSRVCVFTE